MLTDLGDGRGAQVERTVTAGDYTTVILLAAILFTLWGMWFFSWLKDMRAGGND